MEIEEIRQILPHRYPMLLVDRVVELELGDRIVAIKNVTANEPFFQGHFPVRPVMPGVLILEAMAQAAGILLLKDRGGEGERLVYLTAVESAKFRAPVVPGDQLRLEAQLLRLRKDYCKIRSTAQVDGKLVAEATLSSALR